MYGQFEGPMTDMRLKTLLGDLDGKTPARMNKAVKILIETPGEKIVKALLKEAKKKNKTIRKNIVIILGYKDSRGVESTLINILREEKDRDIKMEACRSLGNVGKSRKALEALLEISGNGDTEITVKAHAAVGKIRKRMYRIVKRRDLPHSEEMDGFTNIDECKKRLDDIERRFKETEILLATTRENGKFIEASDDLLDKMREISKRKSPALKRAETALEKMKEKRAKART